MTINEVFEKEWAMWKEGGDATRRNIAENRTKDRFDENPKVGEIRIFADLPKPFVSLVIAENGEAGWLVVPVSPLTVPASEREMLVGERVFQLWNACTAAKSLVERSWVVDTVGDADFNDIRARLGKVAAGRIVAGEGSLAEYERTFLVSGGNCKPLIEGFSAKTAKKRRFPFMQVATSIAAMFLVVAGGAWFFGRDIVNMFSVGGRATTGHDVMATRSAVMCEEQAAHAAANVKCAMYAPVEPPGRMMLKKANAPVVPYADHGTERYAEFNENEFLSPKDSPLSTFSLDVDTSSYSLMRRYLAEEKRLPPANSVRLEEFVNYFKYEYPQPKDDSPIAIDCELADCPWNRAHKLLRVGVQAKRLEEDTMPPCNLTFLVDCSGSMSSNNGMGLLKDGLRLLVGKLRPEDHVSIVTYASGTEVRLPSTPGSSKSKILDAIESLNASGYTSGGAGLQLAYQEAERNFDKNSNNRVILVTDGDFNVGISSPKELENFIETKRSTGIFLSVIGVGSGNYQDANMKKLANAGNGNYAYLDSILEAKKVMLNEFGGTLFTVAKDVKIQIEFNPVEVSAYRLLGYENRMLKAKDFNDDKKDAGEMGSGHTMTAFYELAVNGESVGDGVDSLKYQKSIAVESEELFTVKLRWKKPDGDSSELKEVACRAADITHPEPSEDFRFASAVAEFALILEDSKFKGEASFSDALSRARGAKGRDDEGYRAEFIRLVETAELIGTRNERPRSEDGWIHAE